MTHFRSLASIDRLCTQYGIEDIYRELYRGIEYVYVAAVAGDVAEFGTSSGRTAITLAKGLTDFHQVYGHSDRMHDIPTRTLQLFDGFEGFPEASHAIDKESPHIATGLWHAGLTKDASPELLAEMCAAYIDGSRVIITPGWYKDTMPSVQPGQKYALVHIDCDFYESTMDVLDRLFAIDAFSDGCAIYFDDWYCNRGSPKYGEQKAWADCVVKYKPQFTDWGAYATVGRRFIIHR